MKILIFTEGTVLVHGSSIGKTREEIVAQSCEFGIQAEENSLTYEDKINYGTDPGNIHDYASYIPVGNAVSKINKWKDQGATIYYLSSRRVKQELEAVSSVLKKYNFPDYQNLLFRNQGEDYKTVAEKLMPDIFIEDDCESIGGPKEMTSTYFSPSAKQKIKTVVVKEFMGLDHLPDNINNF
ncbi:hypothetical protein HY310_03005 [Candidatus Microgenomates bacterium]|nr:hypothetical protein [Candidatus Microgenomates bacterium]